MVKYAEEQERAAKAALKLSLESTQEFFDMWTKNYQSTFGKLVQMPAIGPIREKQEKIIKGFPLYVNLYSNWIESNINFQNVFLEATRKTYEKQLELAKENKGEVDPDKCKDDIYKIWLDTYSETFKEFLKSGHFLSDMNKLMSNLVDFQKYNRDTIEENILRPGNLPTKTDIDEINKELYSLKKMIKELKNQVEELSKELSSDDKDKEINNISEKDIKETP